MHLKDADKKANSVDSDQTAPSGGSTPFAQTFLSQKLRIITVLCKDKKNNNVKLLKIWTSQKLAVIILKL